MLTEKEFIEKAKIKDIFVKIIIKILKILKRVEILLNKELEILKNLSSYTQSCRKFFLKQGAFSLYHSKNMDNFIKKLMI